MTTEEKLEFWDKVGEMDMAIKKRLTEEAEKIAKKETLTDDDLAAIRVLGEIRKLF